MKGKLDIPLHSSIKCLKTLQLFTLFLICDLYVWPPFGNLNNMLKNGMHCYFGAEKWYAASKTSKEFKDYISIENARPCKNDTLYKAH